MKYSREVQQLVQENLRQMFLPYFKKVVEESLVDWVELFNEVDSATNRHGGGRNEVQRLAEIHND
jgi:hypothetical protein